MKMAGPIIFIMINQLLLFTRMEIALLTSAKMVKNQDSLLNMLYKVVTEMKEE